ncbi:N-glycosyltransferase [Mariniflexile rhizosphaerae]|uniref:glycosyltransferase family 2 protein n=1 Tax=unclassified Mariniflexile TaxID=2643887 RepID=UPI000CC2C6C9|nr:glycosyltransferase [Mariniflexile sp. TRM1-10]AXP79270.1 N-glycosyltransferase [Mariniflexile sp. TRM1-10]PLB17761.1 MAG: Glycosyl transferase family 2 [Flavobacteriaceae bacterium FS1-H7996/R]
MTKFSILITTKDRLSDLKETLNQLACFIDNDDVEFIICDDGSSDGTSTFIETNYKSIQLIKNAKSKGLIFSRNRLLNLTKAKYAITLDDDAHIVSQNPLEIIETFFESNKKCAVIAFRVFWGKTLPDNLNHTLVNARVKGFVGCGHVWRMDVWRSLPNYPDWFVFYGEEEFAGFHLFKKDWEIWFVPDVLAHHRVDVKARKKHQDYTTRLRRSLRSGWYLYLLFYPLKYIPKRLAYTLWMQLKLKVFKGDFRALLAILGAIFDVLFNLKRLIFNRNALNNSEYQKYKRLPDTFLYWTN